MNQTTKDTVQSYNKKILIADDEESVRNSIHRLLEKDEYMVITASDGQEAVKLIQAEKPQIVLLDVNMPQMNGFEITRQLRSNPETRLLPIVLITSLSQTQDRIQGIEAGCDDFISKPFDTNEVMARVKSLLKISYYRSLLDEKEKLESIMNQIEIGIVILDPNLKMIHFNQKIKDFLLIQSSIDGKSVFLEQISKSYQINYVGDLLSDLKTKSVTFELSRQEAALFKPLVLSVKSNVVMNPAGELSSIVMSFNEITEFRHREFQKLVFLDLISHKLRTPLSVILGRLYPSPLSRPVSD